MDDPDTYAFLFLLAAVIGQFAFSVLVTVPSRYEDFVPQDCIHIYLSVFVFFNILGNFFMIKRNHSVPKLLPCLLKPGWHYCEACVVNLPERAFHCHTCNVCVLKRDHHCSAARCCIGVKNFRYFLLFLFYLSIGSLYATFFNLFFIWDILDGSTFFSLTVPWALFIFFMSVFTIFSLISLFSCFYVTYLFIMHFQRMLYNQTAFERKNGIRDYDLGWKNNVIESLGKSWYIVWVCPFFYSFLPNHGFDFKANRTIN